MTTARDHLSKADTVTVAAIDAGVPMLVEARSLIDSFHSMIRKKIADDLEPWTTCASKSLVASFASGILRDRAAVRAAIRPSRPEAAILAKLWYVAGTD